VKEEGKTKAQLIIDELAELRQRVAKLEAADAERKRAEEALAHERDLLQALMDNIPDTIYFKDTASRFVRVNKAQAQVLGVDDPKEAIGKTDFDFFTLGHARDAYEDEQEVVKSGQPLIGKVERIRRADGQFRWVSATKVPMLDEEGQVIGTVGVSRDITERVRAEREIEERRRYLEGVLNAAPDAIVTLDAHHRIVEWNPGAERLFGYSREETIGQNIDHLVTNPDVFEEATGFTQTVMGGKELPPTEAVRYRKDGSPVDVLLAGSPILVGDELIGAVAVYTDITARVRMEEALRAMALLDELTGLYNRRGFFTLGQQQLKTAHRTKRRMVLLFADLDGMKRINDTFGHPEGDRALIETADVLRETFRESDIIARIGGDEFVVLAIETNGFPAEVLTHRLQENLEARNARGDRRYKLSLSVGLARYDPESPCSIDDLLTQADRLMYERKRGNQKA